MRLYLSFFIASLVFTKAQAQVEGQQQIEPELEVTRPVGRQINGKLLDPKTGKAAEGVTVQLFGVDTTTDALPISVQITRANGNFSFGNLPQADSFRLTISSVGFEPIERWVVAPAEGIDLGNITLQTGVQTLQSVVVTARRPALQMGVDRRVFSADQSLTATGGTAVDLMKNIPSVSVDVDGNVQLRNASPQIFVDGRPTILTLDQIPADNIERVELITNPSAKFDASSSGGIINIVLKQNRRTGLNGIVSAGAGHPDIRTGNVNLNMRQGKFNFFTIGSYNQSGGRARGQSERQNFEDGATSSFFNQYSWNNRLRKFGSIRFGADYFLDNRNTISVTQNFVRGRFSNNQEQAQEYYDGTRKLLYTGERLSESASRFNRYNSQLNYIHKFLKQGRELSANINYSKGDGGDRTFISNIFTNPDGSPYNTPAYLSNFGDNESNQLTVQVDYESPQGENGKLEAGLRSFTNNQHTIFNSYSVAGNIILSKLPISNNYKYREQVNAAYVTYTNKIGSIGYQAGLRAEQSQFDGELVDSAQKFGYNYPSSARRLFDALFPSLYLTKELGDRQQLQLNYSRRIRRPDFWNLNPFTDISDPQNISRGNPLLRPEYTNSIEMNYSNNYQSGNFLGSIYFRNNQGDITRYSDTISQVDYSQLGNVAIDSNAILSTFVNAQYTNRMGVEATLQQKLGKNLELTPTVSVQYRKVKGTVGNLVLDNKGFNWEAKLIAAYNIRTANEGSFWNNFGLQAVGEYESREVVPQGVRIPNYSMDAALRKDFLKNRKATITFSVQDVFNSLRFGSEISTAAFYQESWSRRNVRSFRVVFSYKFGDANFTFGRRNDRRGGDDDDS